MEQAGPIETIEMLVQIGVAAVERRLHQPVPAISLPLFRDQGLPLGLQVVGFENDDPETFAAAAWMESALG